MPENVTVTVYVVAAASVPPEAAPEFTNVTLESGAEWGSSRFEIGERVPVSPAQPALGIFTAPCFGEAIVSGLQFNSSSCEEPYFLDVGFNSNCTPVGHVESQNEGCPYKFTVQSLGNNAVQFEYGP